MHPFKVPGEISSWARIRIHSLQVPKAPLCWAAHQTQLPFPLRLFPVISNGTYKAWSKSDYSSMNSPTSANSANCFLLGSELCHLPFRTRRKAEIHHLRGYTLDLTLTSPDFSLCDQLPLLPDVASRVLILPLSTRCLQETWGNILLHLQMQSKGKVKQLN